ncbi:SEC31 (YDL195W) [Zygosaccharomyces parabailii]|nr:SEC31 (YDL195W) [Zygosaccharomyces parabailii]CDH14012.1 related to Protein transport protein SEC31 [Zygosaccharomyces bailii ISA1307]
MVKLADYSRTATFAWSHDKIPSLVTGTASGTVDADFSSESTLELWSLLSADASKPKASLSVEAKFNDLDWSFDNKTIAGALDNGTIELFSSSEHSLKSEAKFQHHKGSAKVVRFNPKQFNVLASGGSKGEIFIWDVNKCLDSPSDYAPLTPGNSTVPVEEVSSLAWNNSLAHVFASAGSTTYASIWDLKAKKEVIHLTYTSPNTGVKAQLSVVEWHPKNSTRVATATGSDNEPSILVWDLRNANTPLQVLSQGHSKGVLSLDWCHQDENLLLSSGRDNTVVLWNPETGQELTQFPTRSNWVFKTKFAPQAPDIFASASFDNKVQMQTLQNLVNTLDQEQTASKQRESESDFWNHVSQEDPNEKPTLIKLQAPSWYGDKSPAAQWAFGGKLVYITADGKGVSITKPSLPGLEENSILGEAIKSNNYTPLINQRLAKAMDTTNEEDWSLLEKLSMDGKSEFLKETLAFDDEEEEKEKAGENVDDGAKFFAKIEAAYVPQGDFKLSTEVDQQLGKQLVAGNFKSAVISALDKDLLLEALVIALDSDDKPLKDLVKGAYFAKHGKQSSLSRFLFSISNKSSEDLVEHLDVSQWKYAARTIFSFYSNDAEKRNQELCALGDRLLESGNRQDSLVLYLAANSLDKVANVWLKEFHSNESKVQKNKTSLYEAHSECLTEFVERFTVFSTFVGSETSITNEELVSKFLEYVNLACASGTFDLARSILETLPGNNEDVKMERERVLLASGKLGKSVSARKPTYGNQHGATNVPVQQQGFGYGAAPVAPNNGFIPPNPITATNYAPVAAAAPVTTTVPKPNPYAPLAANPAAGGRYAPVTPSPAHTSFNLPPNPYASAGATSSPYTPMAVKPTPGLVSPPSASYGNVANAATNPPPPTMKSGQAPHLNKKANDGWNDLPLNVKEKPQRAKAPSVAPINIGVPTANPLAGTPATGTHAAPPPRSIKPSSRAQSMSSPLPPPPPKSSRMASISSSGSIGNISPNAGPLNAPVNPYAPQAQPPSIPNTPRMSAYAAPVAQPPAAPFAYSQPGTTPSPVLRQTNPYAPPPQQVMPVGAIPPTRTSTSAAPAPAAVPPPPTNLKKKNHASSSVESASTILEAVQRKPDSLSSNGLTHQMAPPVAAPPKSAAPLSASSLNADSGTSAIPDDQQDIVDYLKEELARVTPLTPKEYHKQLKDCDKRLNILFQHLAKQDLLTQPTIDKLRNIVELLKEKSYPSAMEVFVDISTNHATEAGNWLTGVKRLIGIAEATDN